MHQILFGLWASSQTPLRELYTTETSPDFLAVFKGPTSKGREKEGGEGRGRKCQGKVEGGIWPTQKFWRNATYDDYGHGASRRLKSRKLQVKSNHEVVT